jgi:hypothetical protein
MPNTLQNLGADAPIVTNDQGAQQSAVAYRFDLIDPPALFALARVLDYGAKRYTENNWRGIPTRSHVNHALVHLFGYLAGDQQDDHLSHALCRVHMALAAAIEQDGYVPRQADEASQ